MSNCARLAIDVSQPNTVVTILLNLSFASRLLQELSVELDERRDEQAGLAASGQRLINSLTDGHLSSAGGNGGDDALMLRRRLDDMNRRWHGLRAKTVAIR